MGWPGNVPFAKMICKGQKETLCCVPPSRWWEWAPPWLWRCPLAPCWEHDSPLSFLGHTGAAATEVLGLSTAELCRGPSSVFPAWWPLRTMEFTAETALSRRLAGCWPAHWTQSITACVYAFMMNWQTFKRISFYFMHCFYVISNNTSLQICEVYEVLWKLREGGNSLQAQQHSPSSF